MSILLIVFVFVKCNGFADNRKERFFHFQKIHTFVAKCAAIALLSENAYFRIMDLNEHTISGRLSAIRTVLPEGVRLVAVSKFHAIPALQEAYEAGQRLFGENRPQEFAAKVPQMPSDVEWHFIGHLQTNKLKLVLPYAAMVQSVDSIHLLDAIQQWGATNNRIISVLLELHLGAEETKHGLTEEEITAILDAAAQWHHIRFCGLMGMATNTEDEAVIRSDFERISRLFRTIRARLAALQSSAHQSLETPAPQSLFATFRELSIGMSGDWRIALEYGATLIRVGTAIFGAREY
jgi:pyridoxal phosphate enzyme (YggS family)